jgi:6-phosphofructokinase
MNQRLSYLARSGDPDALDSIAPIAFGNLALDLIMENRVGLLVAVRNCVYSSVPLDLVLEKKVVDVDLFYNTERLRPNTPRSGHGHCSS